MYIGDVAYMKIFQKQSNSMMLCSTQNKKYSPFLSLGMFLACS